MGEWLPRYENFAASVTQIVALTVDLVAMLIIAHAVVRAFVTYADTAIFQRRGRIEIIRFHLGKGIILALEFLIGADILRTTVSPSWTLLGQLAVIILLRTMLDYFLEWELGGISRREREEQRLEEQPGEEE